MGQEKKMDAQQTAGGPRKIFNPNNEYCRSLPQSAFPVIFHGQAWQPGKAELPGVSACGGAAGCGGSSPGGGCSGASIPWPAQACLNLP